MHTSGPNRMRRGSLVVEAVLILPLVIAFMLVSVYVLEAMVFRQDLAAATRTAAAQAAAHMSCIGPGAVLDPRGLSTRSATVTCSVVDAEAGLRSERPFFNAMEQAYSRHWPRFWRDIEPGAPVPGHVARGQGSVQVTQLSWIARGFGAVETAFLHRRTDGQLWTHHNQDWKKAMDPVIWAKLSERGTFQLFPRVFPAR
jgi:hypothetical protein